jgi:trk system potassium uptake protein TrkA
MRVKQFLVIGVGRFGSALATTLFDLGHEVVAIDTREASIETVMNEVTHAAIMDSTDEEALRTLGISNFDTVVVAIGNNLEANILTTVAVKNMGAKYVICKANSELSAKVLEKVGADAVIRPEHDMGVRLAEQIATPSIVDAFKLGDNHSVIEIEAQQKIFGKLGDLNLTNRFGVQVIAVNHRGSTIVSPRAEYEITRDDMLVLIGSNSAIEKFRDYLGG